MRGAVLYGQRDVRCEERAVPTTAMTTHRHSGTARRQGRRLDEEG
jgi:hypothetical protein